MAATTDRRIALSWGEAMSAVRAILLNTLGTSGGVAPTFTWSFGTSAGHPMFTVANTSTSAPDLNCVLAFLEPGDKSSAREMQQSPGFDGSVAPAQQGSTHTRTQAQEIQMWKECVADGKKQLYDVYGRGIAAPQVVSTLSDAALNMSVTLSTTKLVDVSEEVSSVETFYRIEHRGAGVAFTDWCDQLPAQPKTAPAVASSAGELSRMASALEDLTLQGIDISFNHGQSIFSVRSKIITG